MNIKLVNSLVQIIGSLTDEERQLLNSQLDRKKNWEAAKHILTQVHDQIAARQGGQTLDLSTEAIVEQVHQVREEHGRTI